jgi:hypothetical protein
MSSQINHRMNLSEKQLEAASNAMIEAMIEQVIAG